MTARLVLYERPKLYPKQEEAIFCDERWGIVEASTKSGKTLGCIVWLHERAALEGGAGRNYWWVAPIFLQAKIAYRRLVRYLPEGSFKTNSTELTVTLANGAVIWFRSAEHPDSLYGEDVYAVVVDEATRVKAAAWTAIRTTLTATRGAARIIGNVKGSRNWMWRLARRAESGAPGYHYARLTVHDAIAAGVFPEEEAEDARSQMTEAEFRELYLAEAADLDDQYFHVETLGTVEDWPRDAKVARAWDFAVSVPTKGSDPDYTVGAKLGWDGSRLFICDVVKRRDSPDVILDLVTRTAVRDGPACAQVFEEEKGAAGAMMVAQFRSILRSLPEVGRVHAAKLTGDKRARAFMFASRVNEGSASMVVGSWNRELLDQLDEFPDGDHDDIVDSCAHAYNFLVPKVRRPGRVRIPGRTPVLLTAE